MAGSMLLMTMCTPTRSKYAEPSESDKCAKQLKLYAQHNGYSTKYCLLIDMSLNSGLKRFFVYDLEKNSIAFSGLVAHGSCDQLFMKEAKFSNVPESGCSSVGIYKVGRSYRGQYGKAYRLHGLQASNSNAFKRAVVLHALACVPDAESYPSPICNSSGCPMVSFAFLNKLSAVIDHSEKPVLLWIYNKSVAGQLHS
jgi:hypothetical protein